MTRHGIGMSLVMTPNSTTTQIPLGSSYHQAYGAINDGQADVVYPYGCGIYQWKADYNMQIYVAVFCVIVISIANNKNNIQYVCIHF